MYIMFGGFPTLSVFRNASNYNPIKELTNGIVMCELGVVD